MEKTKTKETGTKDNKKGSGVRFDTMFRIIDAIRACGDIKAPLSVDEIATLCHNSFSKKIIAKYIGIYMQMQDGRQGVKFASHNRGYLRESEEKAGTYYWESIITAEENNIILEHSAIQTYECIVTAKGVVMRPVAAKGATMQPVTAKGATMQPVTAKGAMMQPVTAKGATMQPVAAKAQRRSVI